MRRAVSLERGSTALPWLLFLASLAVLAWLWFEPEPDPPDLTLESSALPRLPVGSPIDREPRTATPAPVEPPRPTPKPAVWVDPPPPPPSELLTRVRESPGDYRRLIKDGRAYLAVSEEERRGRRWLDTYKVRRGFTDKLDASARRGDDFLATPDALRWLVRQCRDFKAPFPGMPTRAELTHQGTIRPTLVRTHVTSDVGLAWWAPSHTPRVADRRNRRIDLRPAPSPLLVTLHDGEQLVSAPRNASNWLAQHYTGALGASLRRDWFVLAPFAPTGEFRTEKGHNEHQRLNTALAEFWQRTPVDFERIVLDCSEQGFPIAATLPALLAGIVFRAGWHLDDEQRSQVVNFANLPIYVVADEFHDGKRLAKDLRDAGHPRVEIGPAHGLVRWLPHRRRPWPKAFRWSVESKDHRLAYWIQVDEADWRTAERTLAVEVVDTEEQPNTILIDAKNIHGLTLHLHDQIVDLKRDVHVVVNGKPWHTKRAPLRGRLRARPGVSTRDVSALFEGRLTQVRTGMNYGWLTHAQIQLLELPPWVAPPPQPAAPAPPPPPPESEFEARPPTVEPLPDPGDLPATSSTADDGGTDWRLLAALLLAALAAWAMVGRRRG